MDTYYDLDMFCVCVFTDFLDNFERNKLEEQVQVHVHNGF